MRIRSTVKLSTFIIISVVLVYSGFAVVIDRTVKGKYRDATTASEIRMIFSQSGSLTTDYVLYRTERAHQQWWTVQGELRESLKTPEYQAFQRRYQIEDLDDRLEHMGEAFTKLTAAIGKNGLSAPEAEANQELQNRLITQIMVISREISLIFDDLSKRISGDVVALQRWNNWLDFIALFILISVIAGNSIFLSRSVVKPVLQLHEGVEIIGRGNLDYRVEIDGTGEIPELSQAFNEMAGNLKDLTGSLHQSQKNLHHLASQLISAQEQERKRIAMELHEDLGQCLTTLKIQLRLIQDHLPMEPVKLREDFDHARNYLKDMVEEIRRISQNLSPTLLENLGLTAALKHLLDEFCKYHKVTINADIDDTQKLFLPNTEINIFRIFQESINNIAKHAQASQVSVTIKRQDGRVDFSIKDNGIGFDLNQIRHKPITAQGMGLASLEERLRMIGAHLDIVSQTGMGTEIKFSIPIDAN